MNKIKAILKNIALTFMVAILVFTTACSKGPDGVVARVNDTDITTEEFNRDYAAQANNAILMSNNADILDETSQNGQSGTVGQELRRQTLENLIQMELVKQDAKKRNIEVDEAKVTEQINKVKEQVGEDQFEEQLKTVGMTKEFYENYVRNSVLMNKYYEALVKEFEAKDEDLKKYYEDNKDNYFKATASHILVADVNEANKIKKELDKGADFAEMAKEKSIDPGSAKNGGELGEFVNGSMVAPFEEAIKLMEKGEISDPVKTDYGYHIIKLQDKKARSFDEIKDELKQTYTQEKVKEYVDKLQKDAKIKRYLDPKDDHTLPEEYKVSLPKEEKTQDKQANNQKDANSKENTKNKEVNKEANKKEDKGTNKSENNKSK